MNSLRFAASSLALLALAACAAPAEGESDSQTADVVAPIWSAAEDKSNVTINVFGSGDVPAGSQCAPGEATYTLSGRFRSLNVIDCTGSPLRMRSRALPLTEAQYAAIVVAARSVISSEKIGCRPGRLINMTVSAKEVAVQPVFATTDRFACEPLPSPMFKRASGLEHVVEVIEPIVAAAPETPDLVFVDDVDLSETVWSPEAKSLTLKIQGEGETPLGSSCIRDAVTYTFRDEPAAKSLYVQRCAPIDGSPGGRLAMKTVAGRNLNEEEMPKIRTSLTALLPSRTAQCTPGARYTSAFVLGGAVPGPPGSLKSQGYTGVHNACVLGPDRAPYVDFAPAVRMFEEVLSR